MAVRAVFKSIFQEFQTSVIKSEESCYLNQIICHHWAEISAKHCYLHSLVVKRKTFYYLDYVCNLLSVGTIHIAVFSPTSVSVVIFVAAMLISVVVAVVVMVVVTIVIIVTVVVTIAIAIIIAAVVTVVVVALSLSRSCTKYHCRSNEKRSK